MACACQAAALDSCGVQASQEREAADIPHGCLSIQSLLSFAPQNLHEKAAEKAFRMTRLRTGLGPCPSRSTDLQSFWVLSSRPTNHFHLSWTGWRIFPHQRPIGIPAPNQNVLHALVDSERLGGSHARVEQVPPSSLRRPLPTAAAPSLVWSLSHTL
jgi:hypothetical protein